MTPLTDVVAYLDSIQSSYPYGVPNSLIQKGEKGVSEPHIVRSTPLDVLFVVENSEATRDDGWKGSLGDLLLLAVDKGMKKNKSAVGVITIPHYSSSEILERLSEATPQARVVVCMGEVAIKAVFGQQSIEKGVWTTLKGVALPILPTVSLSEVASSPVSKREFWEDLKKVLTRLLQ